MDTRTKILVLDEVVRVREEARAAARTVVCVSGSFDPLHSGHVAYLEFARNQGDVLLVLVNSDQSIRAYKGKDRPLINEEDRSRVVAALACVDYVAVFDEITPVAALSRIAPDIFVNGSDWGRECIEKDVVQEGGGEIRIFEGEEADSSRRSATRIIRASNPRSHATSSRAVFLDRDGTIIIDTRYPTDSSKITFVDGAAESLAALTARGFELVVVTNQSAIGRGMCSSDEVALVNEYIDTYLRGQGVCIKAWYVCPHVPEDKCDCRKPSPQFLIQAAHEHDLVLNDSWMVGDKESDVLAGRLANVKTVRIANKNEVVKSAAHHTATSLKEVVAHILKVTDEAGIVGKS